MPEQTIADGLQRIINAKTDIDGAIEAKDGTVTKGLENSDEDIMTIPTGATSYSPLTDKPAIDNHTLMPGNNTSSDLGLQTKLTFDSAPTENSTNPVTSGGVYTALSGKQATIDSSHKLSADNVDDTNATNKFATAAQLAQISTNQTNIGKVQTQANWNTNNGVKNFATINDFTYTGYYKDILVDGSLTGNVVVYIGNIISTDTDANQCAVLFIYTDNTSSPIHLVNRGTSSSFSANLETSVLKSIRIYPSDNYVHSPGDTVTVTDLMVCPKSLYDADPNYEPYALPNSTLTQQTAVLEELNGAKNLAPYNSGEHIGNASYWFLHTNCIDIAAGTSVYLVYDYTQTAGQYSLQLTDENGQIISGTASYTTDGATSGHRATKVTIPTGKTAKGYNAYHNTNATVTISNFMIVPAEIYEAGFTDYQPYALPNTKITPELIELVDSGAKNLLPNRGQLAMNDVTYTWNSNGTVTVSGAKSASTENFVNVVNTTEYANLGLKAGDKIVISNNGTNTYVSVIFWGTGGYSSSIPTINGSTEITLPSNYTKILIRLASLSAATLVSETISPMVCTKAAWDVSQKFVPHRPTYEETVEQVAIVDITSNVTAESGYTVDATSHLYRQGRHIFGTLIIKKASGNFSNTSQETIATIGTYAPEYQYLGISGFTNTIWAVQNIGYAFVQNAGASGAGSITVMDTATTNNCVKIPIDYVTT